MKRKNRFFCWVLLLPLFGIFGGRALAQDDDTIPDTDIISANVVGDLGFTVAGPSSPTGTKRPPRVGPNVVANAPQQGLPNGLFGRSETSVAATPDGTSILVGFNDAQGFCGAPFGVACTPEAPPGLSGYSFSTDGGLTFTDGGSPDPAVFNNVFTRGDPWMALGGFDNATFYYANLAIDATTGAALGVSVHRGHFNGSSFAFEDVQTFNAPNTPHDFYDKEAIATATDGGGGGYVSVTNFIQVCGIDAGGFGQIEVWRTHDGGLSWQGPTIVSADKTDVTDPTNPACDAGGTLQQSSSPAIGPNGEVYVSWQLGPHLGPTGKSAQIAVARSLDGGVTFGSPVVVASINSMRNDPAVGYNRNRTNDHPRIAVATSGPHKGRVYVTYYSAVAPVFPVPIVSCPSGFGIPAGSICIGQNLISTQVFETFSDDRGATWSTPAALSSSLSAASTGIKRFWPVVSVEPSGAVDYVYYESQETATASNPECVKRVARLSNGTRVFRVGTANSLVDTFWVESTDGGLSFTSPMKVTTATSNWCTTVSDVTPNFGDYIGASSGGNRVFTTWADGRNGVPDTFVATGLGSGKSH
jgi:hypothetical protein